MSFTPVTHIDRLANDHHTQLLARGARRRLRIGRAPRSGASELLVVRPDIAVV